MTDDKKGMSPVIGVVIMVAITVILAAVIAAIVFGSASQNTIVTPTQPAPSTQQDTYYSPTIGPLVGIVSIGREMWSSPVSSSGMEYHEYLWNVTIVNTGSNPITCPGGIMTALAKDDGTVGFASTSFLKSGEWNILPGESTFVDSESYGMTDDVQTNPETDPINFHVVCMDSDDTPKYHLWAPIPAWNSLPHWYPIGIANPMTIGLQEW
jgi:flagellin-like protein